MASPSLNWGSITTTTGRAHCTRNPSRGGGLGWPGSGHVITRDRKTSVYVRSVVTLPRSSPPVTPLYPYVRPDLYGRRPHAAHPDLNERSCHRPRPGVPAPFPSAAPVSPDHLITHPTHRIVVVFTAAVLARVLECPPLGKVGFISNKARFRSINYYYY